MFLLSLDDFMRLGIDGQMMLQNNNDSTRPHTPDGTDVIFRHFDRHFVDENAFDEEKNKLYFVQKSYFDEGKICIL